MLPRSISRAWIEERLQEIHPAHVVGFSRFVVELRKTFDGDLDAMLILACISASVRSEDWQGVLRGVEDIPMQNVPTNALSISQFTGIPRETVRRRVLKLEANGWIRRDKEGNWVPTASAAKDLRPATEATITYLKTILGAAAEAHRKRPG